MKFITQILGQKFIAGSLAFMFATIAFLGVHFTMRMNMDGEMQNCPFLGQMEGVCPMTAAQHVSEWQRLLLATFQPDVLSQLLLILAAMASAFILFKNPYFFRSPAFNIPVFSQKPLPSIESSDLFKAFGTGMLRKRE